MKLPATSLLLLFGAETTKPYLHPLRSASGKIVTRQFPVAARRKRGPPGGADWWSARVGNRLVTRLAPGYHPPRSLPGRFCARLFRPPFSGTTGSGGTPAVLAPRHDSAQCVA
jgi:hypothetical protein